MMVNRITALFAGTVATIAGLIILFFVVKGIGDLLFPELPGFSLRTALLFILAAMLLAAFLFVEACRLVTAAAESKRAH
jgi:hypothetical protein